MTDCLAKLRDPRADLGQVAVSLQRDPLVTSRLMGVVNSPAYGGRGKITSVQQAISRLGIKRTRSLLFELSIRKLFSSRDPLIRETFRQLWEHCMAVGVVARDLAADHVEGVEPDMAYLAGLLHDVGKPVTAAYLLDAERSLLETLGSSWMSNSLWLRVVDRCHTEAGSALAKQWNLPKPIARANEQQDRYDGSDPRSRCADLVRYADALTRLEGVDAGEIDYEEAHAVACEGRNLFGLSEEIEAELTDELGERVRRLAGGDEPEESPSPRSASTRQVSILR